MSRWLIGSSLLGLHRHHDNTRKAWHSWRVDRNREEREASWKSDGEKGVLRFGTPMCTKRHCSTWNKTTLFSWLSFKLSDVKQRHFSFDFWLWTSTPTSNLTLNFEVTPTPSLIYSESEFGLLRLCQSGRQSGRWPESELMEDLHNLTF